MTADRRQGRGRLNSIELLPDEAEPDIVWAMQMLRERSMPQTKILEQFNARLADRGIAPISVGAFSRHSVKTAAFMRRMEDMRAVTAVMTDRLEPGQADDLTIAATEMVKVLVMEMGQNADPDSLTPKHAKEMADALRSAASAQNVSTDRRRKLEAEMDAKLEQAAKAVESLAKERGMGAETIDAMKARVLGVRK